MHSHVDFASSWEAVTCWLPKPVLKRCPWINVLTKIFTVCNFGNTSAMTIIFSLKMFKISCRIKKWNKKLRKSFGLEIIGFEFGVGNFHNLEQDTRIRKSVCKQIPLRFHLTLGETFSKSTSLRIIKKLHKSSLMAICQPFVDVFTCWLPKPLLKRCSLESFLTKIFTFCSFGNTLAMTIIFSFKTFKIWCRFQRSNKNSSKSFSFPR